MKPCDPLLGARLSVESSSTWLRRLEAAEVPCAPINDVLAALTSPQALARNMVVDVDHPELGPIRQVGVPAKLAATPATIRSAPPLLGEQTDEVLAELGYDRGRGRPPASGRGHLIRVAGQSSW